MEIRVTQRLAETIGIRHRTPRRRTLCPALGALGLVVDEVVLWNTLYMDAVLAHVRY